MQCVSTCFLLARRIIATAASACLCDVVSLNLFPRVLMLPRLRSRKDFDVALQYATYPIWGGWVKYCRTKGYDATTLLICLCSSSDELRRITSPCPMFWNRPPNLSFSHLDWLANLAFRFFPSAAWGPGNFRYCCEEPGSGPHKLCMDSLVSSGQSRPRATIHAL